MCAITGKPAKYRDPISGLPYADLAAFKELRKLHPDPKKPAKEEAPVQAGGEGADGDGTAQASDEERAVVVPSERPIRIGEGFSRRVNKVW